jgi:flagellar assembly protein FliH
VSRTAAFVPLGGGAPSQEASFRPLGVAEDTIAPAGNTVEEEPEAVDEIRRAFKAGYEHAREELERQAETIAESFVKALEEVAAFRGRLRDKYERELLEVALGVARKVVQQELAERPEIWLGMIRAAVRRAVERERIVVRVPAALASFLRERMPQLRASLEEVKELEIVEDPALPATGCVVESRFGDVDLGVDTQIEAARAALLRAGE